MDGSLPHGRIERENAKAALKAARHPQLKIEYCMPGFPKFRIRDLVRFLPKSRRNLS